MDQDFRMKDEIKQCSSCGAPIFWRMHERTGKKAPIDATPNPFGNVVLTETGWKVLKRDEQAGEIAEVRYSNHFQTCPNAALHKKHQEAKEKDNG